MSRLQSCKTNAAGERWEIGRSVTADSKPCTSLSLFQGGEATPQNADSRLLIVGGRFGINSALLVNRTLGLRNIEQMEPREVDADPRPWVGEQYSDPQGNVWKRLNLRNLLGQPDFLEIGLS
jgi:twitching motility protein PilI